MISFMIVLHKFHHMCPQYLVHQTAWEMGRVDIFLNLKDKEKNRVLGGFSVQVHRTDSRSRSQGLLNF